LALKQFYIKNVGPAKIQRVQQKISTTFHAILEFYFIPKENRFHVLKAYLNV
jgi:hypothetical protein